ncbi:LuxR C-terminal-related transcriptional regulator [Silvimonas sp.]|uniref:LuxR C-terminal-related transcriptional regulator n=1 Tax=Silvimonas sp. TaxID=2650811 RepID=UPI00284DA429|nr:LuxR C-terminal-related transcriptional regulator [Silvimonas sp.]MDR3428788.1 LuxR C-terminal-related transcriptional regulator [Silvimonas sp.]
MLAAGAKPASLTPQETNIWHLVAEGYAYPRIARELGISIDTVRRHASRIKKKLGLNNAVSLACSNLSVDLIRQVLKTLPTLSPLTAAELTTLAYACRGFSSKNIAQFRGVSPRTADKQRETGMAKVAAHSILELASMVRNQYVINGIFLA